MGWKQYWVYMVTNFRSSALYTGVTNSLERRVWQHKNGTFRGFTSRYRCDRLVYFEEYGEITQAIAREKEIKGWTRAKKNALIAAMNPEWLDLAADWYGEGPSPSSRLRMTPGPEARDGEEELKRDTTGTEPDTPEGAPDTPTPHPSDPHTPVSS